MSTPALTRIDISPQPLAPSTFPDPPAPVQYVRRSEVSDSDVFGGAVRRSLEMASPMGNGVGFEEVGTPVPHFNVEPARPVHAPPEQVYHQYPQLHSLPHLYQYGHGTA